MLPRRFGAEIRGKPTAASLFAATVLGSLLGFVPGFVLPGDLGGGLGQAPVTILGIGALAILLQTNLMVFAATALVTKGVSLLVMPVSFAVGRVLLDGPTEGLFAALVNAPVIAWSGLEYYATTGGLAVGLVVGVVLGSVCHRISSRLFECWRSGETVSGFGRFVGWILVGRAGGQKTPQELLAERARGVPVRPLGVVFVVVFGGILWVGQSFLNGPMLRGAAQRALERWNGATVDLAEARVDLVGGKIVIAGLGMADPEALASDLFAARTLELDVDTSGLLAKRLIVESIRSSEASSGTERSEPGVILYPRPRPPAPPPRAKTLDDWLVEAEQWKARLEQVADWLEQIVEGDGDPSAEHRDERIDDEARELGLANVTAVHLFEDTPGLLVRELVFESVHVVSLGEDVLDLRATNLSTAPRLVAQPVTLSIESRSGAFRFGIEADPGNTRAATAALALSGIPVDSVASKLKSPPLRGGTIDLAIGGALDFDRADGPWIDLPLQVTLRNTTLVMQGAAATPVDELVVPIGLRGPLASPSVSIDDAALADALVAAGRRELANHVRAQAAALLDEELPGDTPEEVLDQVQQKAEEEARKVLPGLFGERKKDG